MMMRHARARPTVLILLVATMLGCVDAARESHHDAPLPIIGGTLADDAALDVVGTIKAKWTSFESSWYVLCNGTLIGAEVVLTTGNCVREALGLRKDRDRHVLFGIGPSLTAPKREVEIAGGAIAPEAEDIGVLFLADPVVGVASARTAVIDDTHLGQPFEIVGYGRTLESSVEGTRRRAPVRLLARRGQTYELLFGSFEDFYDWRHGKPPPTECGADAGAVRWDCEDLAQARLSYTWQLETTGDVLIGFGPAGERPCRGDRGAPLLRIARDGLSVFALHQSTFSENQGMPEELCELGAVAQSLTPAVQPFIAEALAWRDPCGDLTQAGACAGSVAQRCSGPYESLPRRPLSIDCATLGLSCAPMAGGVVGCDATLTPRSR